MFKGCDGQKLGNGLRWLAEPPRWGFSGGTLAIEPAGVTDFFRPFDGVANDNACLLYAVIAGDFTAIACASATLHGFGDAAALTVRADPEHWAKICVERSPVGEVSIVSVVTNGFSDDANNELLPAPRGTLRLTRKGNVFGMHYSLDGVRWRFVRTFGMAMPREVMVGVHAQAPFGHGCAAEFSSFTIVPEAVKDFRA
jgi:regulation of enolase protein 1 (concanavalin A-like superfamily)